MITKLKSLIYEENAYTIAVRERKEQLLFETSGGRGTDQFSVLPVTGKVWYADPMVFHYDDKDWLFCEIYDRETDLGSIGVTELNGTKIDPPREILNIGTHLSYPCVFEMNNSVYMIPETTTRKNILLYKAEHFPDQWVQVKEIMHGEEWADTTVFTSDQANLMLTFEQYQGNGSITKLHVYNASKLSEGIITDYPSNDFDFEPCSRGAGYLFYHNGKLLRPSQNCMISYGYALCINEVNLEPIYSENKLFEVQPENISCDLGKKIIGIHSYCLTEEYEIIDVKFNDPVLRHQIRRVTRYIGRKLRRR